MKKEIINNFLTHILILIFYLILTLVVTYPLIVNFTTHLGADSGDGWQNIWNIWLSLKAFTEGRNPFYTDYHFYPLGTDLYFHTLSPINSFFAALLMYIGASSIVAYNIVIIINFILTGYAQFLLARYFKISFIISILVGILFTFGPYHLAHTGGGHFQQTSVQWFCLYILFFLKTLELKDNSSSWIAGIFLILVALSNWYDLIFLFLITAIILIGKSVRYSYILKNKKFWLELLKIPLIFTIFMGPLIIKMTYLRMTEEYAPGHSSWFWSSDLLTLFTPNKFSFWKDDFTSWRTWTANNVEASGYIGYGLLILSIVAFIRAYSYSRIFFIIGVLFALLQLGPYLHIEGKVFWDYPMLYRDLERYLPIIKFMGCPGRCALVTCFTFTILAGQTLTEIINKISPLRIMSIIVISSILIIEYLPGDYPITSFNIPQFYHNLARDKGNFTVLDLTDLPHRYYSQTIHEHPLISGHIARDNMKNRRFIQEDPVLGQIASTPGYKEKVLERIDSEISFDWGNGSPDPSIPSDHFEIIWKGRLKVPSSGFYRFRSDNDDGVELRIDGSRVINDWWKHHRRIYVQEKWLWSGEHDFELRYFEDTGPALVYLSWAKGDRPFEPIPHDAYLTPDSRPGLLGTYYKIYEKLVGTRQNAIDRLKQLNIKYIIKPKNARTSFEKLLQLPVIYQDNAINVFSIE